MIYSQKCRTKQLSPKKKWTKPNAKNIKTSSFCNWRQATCSAAMIMDFKQHLRKFTVSL